MGRSCSKRQGTRIRLTAAGQQFQNAVTAAFRSIEHAAKALPREDDGVVSLRVKVAAASLWVMPALGAFYARFPDVRLQLVCIDELPEFSNNDFDLEIRFGTGSWPNAESYPLLEERVYPVASRKFIAAHEIKGPECLNRVPLLQLENFSSP